MDPSSPLPSLRPPVDEQKGHISISPWPNHGPKMGYQWSLNIKHFLYKRNMDGFNLLFFWMVPNNNVLLVKIEGPVWHTIYHHLPIVKVVYYTPLLINQPMGTGHLWFLSVSYSMKTLNQLYPSMMLPRRQPNDKPFDHCSSHCLSSFSGK